MAVSSITQFLAGFGGGTRVNRFQVTTAGCGAAGNFLTNTDTQFHIRAATIPGSNIVPIGINYFGRTINIPGERVYEPWSITVLDDRGDKQLYNKFKAWHKRVTSYGTDISIDTTGIADCTWTITHLKNADETAHKTFTLSQAWPATIGPLILDMSQDNVLASFEVKILYTHFNYTHT